MFGGLLPGYPTRGAQIVTHVTFLGGPPTVSGIKVINITFVFATTQRQTVVLKTITHLVNFGVAAPRP